MKTNWFKRTLCSILVLVLVLGYVPVQTIAAESDGLCEHHTQHTTECGYSAAVAGHDCGHEHTDDCYNSVTACVHVHEDCGYVAAVEGHSCDCQPDENGEIVHTEGCGYVEAAAEVPCGHVCSEETGCVTKELNCQHQHDATCGYAEEVAESTCAYQCEECKESRAAESLLVEIPMVSIEISADTDCIVPGETLQLTVTILPEDTTNKAVIWSSLDESVLTVDESGLVAGIAGGCTFVTATAADGSGVSAQYEIAVFDEAIMSEMPTFMTANDDYAKALKLMFTQGNVARIGQRVEFLGYNNVSGSDHFAMLRGWNDSGIIVTDANGYAQDISNRNAIRKEGFYSYSSLAAYYGIKLVQNPNLGSKTSDEMLNLYDEIYNELLKWKAYKTGVESASPPPFLTTTGVSCQCANSYCNFCNAANVVPALKKAEQNGILKLGNIPNLSSYHQCYSCYAFVWFVANYIFGNDKVNEVIYLNQDNYQSYLEKFSTELSSSISLDDYLNYYAQKVSQISRTAVVNGTSADTWKLPWTNKSDENLKLGTVSGEITLIREIVNHVGNTWYEYSTGTSTRGFIYSGDVTLKVAEPYYNEISVGTITTDNAFLKAKIQNPSRIKLVSGGVRLGTSLDNLSQEKTFNIPSSYQTNTTIECSYDLKTECGFTLQPGIRYYYQFFVAEDGKQDSPYVSDFRSFDTASVPVSSISLSPSSKTLNIGDTVQLTATISPSNATNKFVHWSSSKSGVASVSSTGLVTAKGAGSAVITATAADDIGKSASTTITVQAEVTSPYYNNNDISVSSITTNNAYLTAIIQNSSCIKLVNGGVRIGTSAGSLTQSKSFDIPTSWQTKAQIDCAYDLKTECGFTLQPGTRYYYQFFVYEEGKPNSPYVSEVRFFDTASIAVSSISLSPTPKTLDIGDTMQFTATVSPTNATNKSLTWKSSDTSVATVSSTGLVTAKSAGTATITATAADGSGKSASATVTVQATTIQPYYSGISHGTPTANNAVLKATINNPSGVKLVQGGFKLGTSTNNLSIVKTDDISASYQTAATIPCSYDLKNEYSITLQPGTRYYYQFFVAEEGKMDAPYVSEVLSFDTASIAVSSISLSPTSKALNIGDTVQLTATVSPTNATNKSVTWKSSNTSVATVSSTGLVTAMGEGTAVITVTAADGSGKSASANITAEVPTVVVASGSCGANGDNVTYTLTNKGLLTITGSGKMKDYPNYDSAPWYGEREKITSVVIEKGITSVGDNSFHFCESLTSVSIPNSVTSIGNGAFNGCKSLASIDIPNSVSSIGYGAFFACRALTSITIPDGISTISNQMFAYCSGLTSVSIPDSVKTFDFQAFSYCDSLTSITIPAGVTSIGNKAFVYCGSLTSIVIPDGVTSIGASTFWKCTGLRSVTLPAGITSIEQRAFSECGKLRDVYYSGSERQWNAITIGSENDCLTNASLHCSGSDPVTDVIASGTCGANGNNATYTLTDKGVLTITGRGKLKEYSQSATAPWYGNREKITSVVIEEGITSIGNYSFYFCSNLSSITIPEGVTSIGNYAFYECNSLQTATLPDSVSSVGEWSFAYCKSLASVKIPEGVTSIKTGTFQGCDILASVTLPQSLSSIGVQAFYNCCSLTSISIPQGVTSIGVGAFSNCESLTTFSIPEGVNAIESNTFYGCEKLTSVSIPKSVTSIGGYAFYSCLGLTSVTLPEGVTSIGEYAFRFCRSLTSISIPKNVTSIGESAFHECGALSSIHFLGNGFTGPNLFNKNVTAYYPRGNTTWTKAIRDSFGSYVTWIEVCTNHTEVVDPAKAPTCTENGLTEGKHCSACGIVLVKQEVVLATHQFEDGQCKICGLIVGSCGENLTYTLTSEGELTITGSGAMDDYVGSTSAPWYNRREEIVSVILSEGVTSIGTEAFLNCSNLISVSIPDGITSIGREAFSCCSKLSSVSIPSGVSSISDHCFYSCTKLTSVSIPEGVTQIEDGAFENCSDLTSISLPNSVTSIGDSAFSDCCRLTKITIPSGVTTIGSGAFRACSQLTEIMLPSGITTIGENTFSSCSRLKSIVIPNGVISIGNDAFRWCVGLNSVAIPSSVTNIGSDAFDNCLSLTSITIPENVTSIGESAFYESAIAEIRFLGDGFRGTSNLFSSPVVAYYAANNATWTQEIRDSFGTKVTWRDSSENCLVLNDSELIKETQIWVDGVSYPVKKDSAGSYVNIPDNTSPVLVTYSYNNSSDDAHTQYPVGMQAYRIHQTETGATVERLPELDNLLQYSGSSIRIVGKKGIRMITSVNQDTRNSLTGNGLAGFKLLEYGTLLAQTSKLGDNPLVLGGGEYVKSNYAYKKGVADPVFKYTNGLIQYTNVLIGFTDEQCKEDIAMRPYMKLLDENGEEFVIYGGIVYRSIGYIAYQNRNAFQPGSAAYEYVWSIIRNVYGNQYDSEYKK